MPLDKPVKLLSPYGPRDRRFHTGIDIRRNRKGGDPVRAARAGKVVLATKLSGYGNVVEIKHADGFSTRYAHLRKIMVRKGERVKSLEQIGVVGQTGRATAPHLHFEILTPLHRFVDPARYLNI